MLAIELLLFCMTNGYKCWVNTIGANSDLLSEAVFTHCD